MGLFRTFLIAGLTMASASTALASGMSVRVCNQGEYEVSTIVAYEDWGFNSSDWVVQGRFMVAPNRCEVVYNKPSSVCLDDMRYWTPCARVRIAYLFTDSKGVRKVADVSYSEFPPKGEKICVTDAVFGERRSAPDAGCSRPGWFLVPAAAAIDTYQGNGPYNRYRDFQGTTLKIALTDRHRTLPVPGADSSARSQDVPPSTAALATGPGKLTDMAGVLDDAIRGPGAPKPHIRSKGPAIASLWVTACVPPAVTVRASWADPNSARARAAKDAIRQFMASHWFRDAGSAAEEAGGNPAAGHVSRSIRLTEANDVFIVQEVRQCTGDYEIDLRVAVADQPPAK